MILEVLVQGHLALLVWACGSTVYHGGEHGAEESGYVHFWRLRNESQREGNELPNIPSKGTLSSSFQ
jgi:hypothetical protein